MPFGYDLRASTAAPAVAHSASTSYVSPSRATTAYSGRCARTNGKAVDIPFARASLRHFGIRLHRHRLHHDGRSIAG